MAFSTTHFPFGRPIQEDKTLLISAACLVPLDSSLRRGCVSVEKAWEEMWERVSISGTFAGYSVRDIVSEKVRGCEVRV
jgi:hypothetical protein